MDLNMSNLLFHGNGSKSNLGKKDSFSDTALRLSCFAIGLNDTDNVGDSCSKEDPPREDACMLFLGLGPDPKIYASGNRCFAAASTSKEPTSHMIHSLGGNVDSGMLQLGLSCEAGELTNNSEHADQNTAFVNRHLLASTTKNQLLSVFDEGSTNGGSLIPSLLGIRNLQYSESIPESTALQDHLRHSSDPSATTGSSSASLRDPMDDPSIHHSRTRMHHPKKCRFKGCSKGARGASGLCIGHGGGQRCQKPGCNKGAESRTAFCKAHGGGRRCDVLGCTKSAEGKTDFCIAHGGGLRCSHEGCTKAARGKSGLCIRHGGGKRCSFDGCIRSAEGQAGLCISHGGGRRCQHPGCTKGAQGSTMNCKAHGGGRRCVFDGCTKGAEGSTPLCKGHGGGKRCLHEGGGVCTKSVHGGTDYCVAHGGGKRCAVPGCTRSARGRTDCCVKHGGGKRCRHEGCGKSAQGSTDFCKAHGGGKRCSWADGCDKFARGKIGLCAAHANKAATAQPQGFPSRTMLFPGITSPSSINNDCSSSATASSESRSRVSVTPFQFSANLEGERSVCEHGSLSRDGFAVPEGRVHGGGLLSLLGGNFESANVNNDGLV